MAPANHQEGNHLAIAFQPCQCFIGLAGAIFALVFISTASRWLNGWVSLSWADDFNRLFDLDTERSIPTLFSTTILLISALLLGIISIFKKISSDSFTLQWQILAVIFLYLGIDESVSIHELFMWFLQKRFALEGVFRFAWVIVAIPFVLGVGLFYLKLVFSLPKRTRNLILAAGLTYVMGALGMEMIGGEYTEKHGFDGLYGAMTTIEEALEMFGISIFIFALLDYLKSYGKVIQLYFRKLSS
jgi:hypothetical protein